MAVTNEAVSSEFVIRVEDGFTSTGAIRYSNLTYRNVKFDAVDNDVKAVADALGAAQSKTVAGVLRSNTVYLIGEPE
ncbi:MAG: DUF1659 domain-containing protein [Syntrophomonadaceae bacterium]|nr:DUF1659 domain-containing protein [Syntrophomonadaceae bacterium]